MCRQRQVQVRVEVRVERVLPPLSRRCGQALLSKMRVVSGTSRLDDIRVVLLLLRPLRRRQALVV